MPKSRPTVSQAIASQQSSDREGNAQGQRDRYNDLSKEWDDYRNKFEMIIDNEVRSYNDLYNKAQLPAVIIPD